MMSISSVGIAVFSSFLLICNLWIFVSCDPCWNARNIGDYRRSIAYAPTAQDPLLCDTDIDEDAWYRFDSHTGGKMPESCVSVLHCGTQLPIWMNGRHPNAADPGPKSVEVCAPFWRGRGGCCQWKGQISVQYCQNAASGTEFYVYQLKKPPFCYMSYCAGEGVPCEKDCAWNGILRKCTCPAYPVITEAPVLLAPRVITGKTKVSDMYDAKRTFYPTKFVVDCEVKYPRKAVDDGARFHVVFEVNGRHLTHFTVSSTNPVATLDESFLVGHLGKELSCKVSSHWESSDVGSRYLNSNRRWFGLNPVNKADSVILYNLVVKEGEKVSLWMKPTFPITTRPCYDAPNEPCFYSSYRFQITKAEKARLSDCAMIFLENSPRSIELEISPIPYVGARPKPVVWQLNFEPYNDTLLSFPNLPVHELPIFKDYRIQGVNIEVRDHDNPPRCSSSGDPHMYTFPNAAGTRNYYHVYGVGDFYLLRLNSRLLEVQVRHVPCHSASCNCGVIVREGNSIIGITKCNQASPLLIKYELDKISPTGTITTISGGWRISLLSGIVITATKFWEHYMSLYVTGLKSELAKYDGLCSATTVARNSYCTSDCDRYRVPASKSFFSVTKNNLPQCGNPFFVPECTCKERGPGEKYNGETIKIACDAPTGDYLLRIDMKRACSKRRKRQAAEEEEEDVDQGEDLISLEDFIDNTDSNTTTEAPPPEPEVEERWLDMGYRFFGQARSLNPDPVLSEEDGRRRCDDALRFSTTYDLCSSRVEASTIVKSCALDVEILNDYAPAKSVPTQFELACVDNIRLSLESYTSSDLSGFEELKKLLERVEKLVCASQCSQHGRCVDSKCQCNEGFMGTDCSLRIGQVPVVQKVIMPVCDIRKHPCTQIHLVASDLTIPENVVCKMRSVDDLGDAVPAVQTSTPVISGGLVLCSLPSMVINVNESTNGISTTVFRVQVSISNDGQTYSQEVPFTVLDGHCMQCPASQTTPCQPKANTCSIGGRCFKAEDSCPQDATRICNPAKCTTKWTGESSTNCDDGFENCT